MAYKKKSLTQDQKNQKIDADQEKVDAFLKDTASKIIDKAKDALNGKQEIWESPIFSTTISNPASKTAYNLENSMILYMAKLQNEYENPLFVTYNQAAAEGMFVEKGTSGHQIVQRFGMPMCPIFEKGPDGAFRKDEGGQNVISRDGDGKPRYIYKRACKLVTVFNIGQLKGEAPAKWLNFVKEKQILENEDELVEMKDLLIESSEANVLRDGRGTNYYSPSNDSIHLVPSNEFKNTLVEIHTTAHEICHSTGHESRLDRESLKRYAEKKYFRGYEELVANFGARKITQNYGISNGDLAESFEKNHDTYDQGWAMPVLKEKPEAIFEAAQDADRATRRVFERLDSLLEKSPLLSKLLNHKNEAAEIKEKSDLIFKEKRKTFTKKPKRNYKRS